MHVLITGGSGFIGQAAEAALVRQGHEVSIFDTSVDPAFDVRNAEALVSEVGYADVVVHLAGMLGTSELFDRASDAVDVNIKGTLNVLDSCLKADARFVGITVPDCWNNVYQATKLAAQRLAWAWRDNFGLSVRHVRAYNAYGPGQKVHGVQKILPTFATRCYRDLPIPIWGDGQQLCDLVHVDDVGRVLARACESEDGPSILDAGTGQGTSVFDLACLVSGVVAPDHPVNIEFSPMRKGETPVDIVAPNPAEDCIPLRPVPGRPEQLDSRFAEAVEWYQVDRP